MNSMYQEEAEIVRFPACVGVLELHIHTDPWDPFLNRAKRVPIMLT